MKLTLPFPPSVNHYWGTDTRGRRPRKFLTEAGREFRTAAVLACAEQGALRRAFSGPLICTVDLVPPDRRLRDVDNYCKGLLDALTHASVYGDDSQIRRLVIEMHPPEKPGRCTVTLEDA